MEKLQKACKEATANVSDVDIKLAVKRGVGQPMGTITGVNKVSEEGECDVKHEAGQVLLLDFWATWCPPCQKPMAHNQEMLEKNGDKWGDKVRLIGLSIDNAVDAVKKHVESNGWNKVEHYHVRNGKCTADKDFGVQGVPHVALVDTEGKIVFVGHPASRPNLEKDINDLLDGVKITGAGCSPAGAAGGDDDEAFKLNVESDKVEEALKTFNEMSDKLLTEESKKSFEGMPRAFCVLVHEQQYNCKEKKTENNMKNYHVLVGPQDKIDAGKKLLEDFHK